MKPQVEAQSVLNRNSAGPISKLKKSKSVKSKTNCNKTPSSQKSKLSKEFRDATVNISSVKHRNCSGVDNWKRFLESQGMSLKINNNPNNNKNKILSGNNNNEKSNKITKVVGIDCEMVGIGEKGLDNMLARVSLVNNFGDCIYDKYVKPREKVTDYRTAVSGIRQEDIQNAEEFEVVQKEVADILKRRILVGHAVKNDLDVLFLTHPKYAIRDTAKFFCKKNKKTPSLKSLALEYLQTAIQEGEHSSVQDAQAAMQLYNMYRKHWESGKGNKYRRRIDSCGIENKAVKTVDSEDI